MTEIKPGTGTYKVTGPVAVVRTLDGSERYLYRGAVFDAGQASADNVKHLVGVGLITKQRTAGPSAEEKAAAEKAAAEAKAAEEKAAAEKAAAAKNK